MKKLLMLIAIISPMLLCAQTTAPKKNKFSVTVMTPPANQVRDFETNLAAHDKEFHKGQQAVDIFEALTGTRGGQYYFVSRNLATWADVQKSFDAVDDKAHSADWSLNVAPHLEGPMPNFIYSVSDDSYASSNRADMETDLQGLYFIELNNGMEDDFFSSLKKIKEMYQKANSKGYFTVQTSVFDKGTNVLVAFPLPQGWASFEPNPATEWPVMFKAAFPKDDFKAFMKKFNDAQKSLESVVIKHRKDLSSPM